MFYLSVIRPSPTTQLIHATENTQPSFLTIVWHAECILPWNRKEPTCKRLRNTWEANRVQTSASTKKKIGRCRAFSHGPCRRFTEGPIDTWAMQPTRRMRFRMHCCPLAGFCPNQGGRRNCGGGYQG